MIMLRKFINWIVRKHKYDFYIAGPMRSYKYLNRPMFNNVSRILREAGFTVWSPAEYKSYLQLSFAQCMIVDLNSVINRCNKIVFLPGWRDSLGANMEAFVAFATGKTALEFTFVDNDKLDDWYLVDVDLSQYRMPYNTG